MIVPTIHSNGTSPDVLKDALRTAHHKLEKAITALAQTTPHGRDYYPQGPDAINAALIEHRSRHNRLVTIQGELFQLWLAIDERTPS